MTEALSRLRRAWLPLVALTLLGALASAGLGLLQGPSYTSTAQVLVRQRDYTQVVLGASGSADPVRQLTTAGVLARSLGYQREVAAALPGVTSTDVRDRLTVSVVDGADALQLSATGRTAAAARSLAAAATSTLLTTYERFILDGLGGADGSRLAGAPIALAQSLARARNFETSSPSMSVLSDGQEALRTDKPLSRQLLIGAMAGLVAALLLVAWRARAPLAASGDRAASPRGNGDRRWAPQQPAPGSVAAPPTAATFVVQRAEGPPSSAAVRLPLDATAPDRVLNGSLPTDDAPGSRQAPPDGGEFGEQPRESQDR